MLLFVEDSTITSLLEDLDLLDNVAILLDKETPDMKNWLHFAQKFDISRKECDGLKPKGIPSPTKKLMEYIVQVNPDLTLKQLIQALEKMERRDVVNALTKFFGGKNCLGQGNDKNIRMATLTSNGPFRHYYGMLWGRIHTNLPLIIP